MFECNLRLTIMARIAYDGSMYYHMEEKEKRDKWEKETKYGWEREQELKREKNSIEKIREETSKILAEMRRELEEERNRVMAVIEKAKKKKIIVEYSSERRPLAAGVAGEDLATKK